MICIKAVTAPGAAGVSNVCGSRARFPALAVPFLETNSAHTPSTRHEVQGEDERSNSSAISSLEGDQITEV